MEPLELVKAIAQSLDKHKAVDLKVIHVTGLTSITDYFVIAEGTSSTQVRSLTDYVETDMNALGVSPLRTEGYRGTTWVLQDYGSVVVHVFQKEAREYYNLERLWKDGEEIPLSELGIEIA